MNMEDAFNGKTALFSEAEKAAEGSAEDIAINKRVAKRKAIAKRAELRRKRFGDDLPSPQEMISQARQERDEDFFLN